MITLLIPNFSIITPPSNGTKKFGIKYAAVIRLYSVALIFN